jgi:hypothetical protein
MHVCRCIHRSRPRPQVRRSSFDMIDHAAIDTVARQATLTTIIMKHPQSRSGTHIRSILPPARESHGTRPESHPLLSPLHRRLTRHDDGSIAAMSACHNDHDNSAVSHPLPHTVLYALARHDSRQRPRQDGRDQIAAKSLTTLLGYRRLSNNMRGHPSSAGRPASARERHFPPLRKLRRGAYGEHHRRHPPPRRHVLLLLLRRGPRVAAVPHSAWARILPIDEPVPVGHDSTAEGGVEPLDGHAVVPSLHPCLSLFFFFFFCGLRGVMVVVWLVAPAGPRAGRSGLDDI